MDVILVREKVGTIAHAAIRESLLPDWEFGFEATREAALDELHGSFERDDLWSDEQVNVVRHDDEGVEFVMTFAAIVLESFEEEFCGFSFLE